MIILDRVESGLVAGCFLGRAFNGIGSTISRAFDIDVDVARVVHRVATSEEVKAEAKDQNNENADDDPRSGAAGFVDGGVWRLVVVRRSPGNGPS